MNQLFDRNLLQIHRNRAADLLHEHDFLLQFSAQDIVERIKDLNFSSGNILELGARSGVLTEHLLAQYPQNHLTICDISAKMLAMNPAKHKILLDEEELDFESQNFALITSVLNIQWINDLPAFFKKINRTLTDDGMFIASFFGGITLRTLRQTLTQVEITENLGHSAHISPFANADDIYRLLQQAGFTFVVVDSQKIEVEYPQCIDLMRELQDMGEANNLTQGPKMLSKKLLYQLNNCTTKPFVDHFEIITLTCSRDARGNLTYDMDVPA